MLISAFGGTGIGEGGTFMVLAGIFLTVCTIGCLFLKNPPAGFMKDSVSVKASTAKPTVNLTSKEMLKTPQYYLITITFLLACMGGLMVIGFAKPIAVAKGLEKTAVIGVLAISMFNSLGRLIWGMVSDKLGRINTIMILLLGSAILSLFVIWVNGILIYVLIALIGLFYGGLLSTFPSLTADTFGSKNLATNYGFVLLGFGIGAIVSSLIAGYYKNIAASNINLMFPAFVIACGCSLFALCLMLVLKALRKKQTASAA